jgi:hypothetical protein
MTIQLPPVGTRIECILDDGPMHVHTGNPVWSWVIAGYSEDGADLHLESRRVLSSLDHVHNGPGPSKTEEVTATLTLTDEHRVALAAYVRG